MPVLHSLHLLGINQTLSSFEQNKQILAYADDVNIISRDHNTTFDILIKLPETAKNVGLLMTQKRLNIWK